jgi:hypothetical protein
VESEGISSSPKQPIRACCHLISISLTYFLNIYFNSICQLFSHSIAVVGAALIFVRRVIALNPSYVTGYLDLVRFQHFLLSPPPLLSHDATFHMFTHRPFTIFPHHTRHDLGRPNSVEKLIVGVTKEKNLFRNWSLIRFPEQNVIIRQTLFPPNATYSVNRNYRMKNLFHEVLCICCSVTNKYLASKLLPFLWLGNSFLQRLYSWWNG